MRLTLSVLCLCTIPLLLSATVQERVRPDKPKPFVEVLEGVGRSYNAQQYGTCMKLLQEASAHVAEKRREQVLAALPTPAGMEVVPERKSSAQANPFAGGMAGFGNIFSRKYRETDGRGHLEVNLTIDSPMVKSMLPMYKMWASNPAMIEEGAELIRYGDHMALLKKQGSNLDLQIIINESEICEVKTSLDEDGLFAVWNQEAVDRVAAVLKN